MRFKCMKINLNIYKKYISSYLTERKDKLSNSDILNSIVINNDNGLVYLNLNPNYETKQTHTFGVYVRDTLGNIGPILEVTLEVRRETKWGPVRYVMLRGSDSLYLALNQLNILLTYFLEN